MARATKPKTPPRKTRAQKPRAKTAKSRGKRAKKTGFLDRAALWIRTSIRWALGAIAACVIAFLALIALFAFVNPPTTPYIWSENRRLGVVDQQWVKLAEIEPVLARSVIAAEDANFCLHWGFDMEAIREALEDGGTRGASTITQQTVKNVFLWHGRSWARKALEALITPVVETVWTKRRIMEVYLNVAEFDEGVFGAEAASRTAFRVGPEELEPWQAARLAAVLPNPKGRSAQRPSSSVRRRAAAIADGAETIRTDGRFDCISTGAE